MNTLIFRSFDLKFEVKVENSNQICALFGFIQFRCILISIIVFSYGFAEGFKYHGLATVFEYLCFVIIGTFSFVLVQLIQPLRMSSVFHVD